MTELTKYRKVEILISKMNDSMQTDVIDITRRGFELYKCISDITPYITKRLDDKWGYTRWNCIIYDGDWVDFADSVYKYENRYILFKIDNFVTLVWGHIIPKHKSNDSSCNIA